MSKKNIYIVIIAIIVILAGYLYFKNSTNNNPANLAVDGQGEEVVIKDVKAKDLDTNSADPILTSKQWIWKEVYLNDGDKIINPVDPKLFTLSFVKGGKFSTTTDCNKAMGNYTLGEKKISMEGIASTKMACEDPYAQEQFYLSTLGDSESYFFRDDGSLIIMLKEDKGTITFSPVVEAQ